MATVSYLFRSKKAEENLDLRLLFTHIEKDYQIGVKTKIWTDREKFEIYYKKKDRKKVNPGFETDETDKRSYLKKLNSKLDDLSLFILRKFDSVDPESIDQKWLKDTITDYYDPNKNKETPTKLIEFFDCYLDDVSDQLSSTRIRRINVIKNFLIMLEEHTGKTYQVKDVNSKFLSDLIKFAKLNKYATNTIKGYLSVIKTVCFYANDEKGLKISNLRKLSIEEEESLAVYLNFEELEEIRKVKLKDKGLDNARDWLLISCFTGQRVSDFMRFNTDMIIKESDRVFLKFKQKKTKTKMKIPFIKEARQILDKRNGQFPDKINEQEYNEKIRTVCRLAGIKEMVKGKVTACIMNEEELKTRKPTKNDYRSVTGIYPKWKLISSHVGRRSFATNFYGKINTANLIYITGHKSESMFRKYIKTSDDEKARKAYDAFN